MPLIMAIQHYEFSISEPHKPEDALTLAQAQALNQLRLENIRNIASKVMAKAQRGGDGLLTGAAEQEVRRTIKDLDEHYEFKLRSPPRVKSSTLEAEIARVAEEAVDAHARQIGAELSEAQQREAEEAYRQSPSVLAEAKRRLAERIRVNSETIEDLIGGGE